MKLAFFSTKDYDRTYFEEASKKYAFESEYFEVPLNEKTAYLCKNMEAVCVFVNDQVNRVVIEILSKSGVKILALRCAGFNNVDLKACAEFNIKVTRVPAYSPNSVAEHAIALLQTLNRKTHKAYNRVRENNYALQGLMGFDLYGKTVGVIGTGKIGQVFCKIMQGFGTKVLAYDICPNEDLKSKGVEYTDLDTLLGSADIISLHCPLNESTKHLIDKEAFAKMKDGVVLVNTSRGALIQTKSAIKALKNKKLGALGLDVYEQEEALFFKDLSGTIIQDDLIARLMSFPNVLITSHQGFFTHEALTQIAEITLYNVSCIQKNGVCENEVNI